MSDESYKHLYSAVSYTPTTELWKVFFMIADWAVQFLNLELWLQKETIMQSISMMWAYILKLRFVGKLSIILYMQENLILVLWQRFYILHMRAWIRDIINSLTLRSAGHPGIRK